MPVKDAARCYACRRPRLPADPFAAELKKLAIPYVVFPIEMRLNNSLPYLEQRPDANHGLLPKSRWKQRILPAPRLTRLKFPPYIRDIPAQGKQHGTNYVSPSISIPRQICFRSLVGFESTFDIFISQFLSVLIPVFCPRSKSTSPFISRSTFRIILPEARSLGP